MSKHYLNVAKTGGYKELGDTLSKLVDNILKAANAGTNKWLQLAVRDIRTAVTTAGIQDFTGNLSGPGIKYVKGTKGDIGEVVIPSYGVKLDSMKNHWTNIKTSRSKFLRWGLQAQKNSVRMGARKVEMGIEPAYGVYVKKKPFIINGVTNALPKLKPLLVEEINRAISASIGA